MSYILKRCFLLPLGEGFKVAGRLSCPLPAAGRSPEVRPSRSGSAVPGLAPVGPVSSRPFPSYCFPGSLGLQQLFTSLGLPFFGRGLSFSPAAPPHPPAPATRVPALLPSLFPIPPATTSQPCCLSSPASSESADSAFAAHSPPFGHRCLPSCAEEEPSQSPAWSCPTLCSCPEHFVSTGSPTKRKGSCARHVEKIISLFCT